MVVSSMNNRSASPMSSRPNPNPNPRSSSVEREGNGVRKSVNGYPFVKSSSIYQQKILVPNNTPVNSTAEYGRRSSFGRDSVGASSFGDHEQKENERDPNNTKPLPRAKSPCIITKGTKHFMSPTISAVSKINPSPRKKVLGDRNEAIRTSASLSDGKFHFFSSANLLDSDDETETKCVIKLPPPPSMSSFSHTENEPEFRPQNGGSEADLVVLSPDVPLKNEALGADLVVFSPEVPLSEMPTMASEQTIDLDLKRAVLYSSPCTKDPLEADPSIAPYDPKNNYLSPRPQFLHYNPNWRTESYANQGINLEDDFTCESGSEIENSCEEVQSQDSSSSFSFSSSEEIYPKEMPMETNPVENQQLVEIDEEKIEPKRARGFPKRKIFSLLLMLSVGLMSISLIVYPETGSAMYREEVISQVYNNPHVVVLVENFNELVENGIVWAGYSVDYLSQMVQNIKGNVQITTLTFANLSALQEDEAWEGYMAKRFELAPYFENIKDVPQSEALENDETFDEDDDSQSEAFSEDNYETFDELEEANDIHEIESELLEAADVMEAEVEENESVVEESDAVMMSEQAFSANEPVNIADDELSVEKSELMEAADDIKPEVVEKESVVEESSNVVKSEQAFSANKPENIADDEFSVENPESDVKAPPQVSETQPEVITSSNDPSEKPDISPTEKDMIISVSETDNSLVTVAFAVILAILALLASFIYMKSKKDKKDTPSNDHDQLVEDEKSYKNEASNSQGEVEMIDESCSSEMSSFQNTTHTKNNQRRESDEADSLQKSFKRKNKREFIAASSSSEYTMNSSYGSFSTYSVIHPKRGDEEVVTPVRRSNRIRSKVTSP